MPKDVREYVAGKLGRAKDRILLRRPRLNLPEAETAAAREAAIMDFLRSQSGSEESLRMSPEPESPSTATMGRVATHIPVYEQMNTSQRSIHIKARRPSRHAEDSAIDLDWAGGADVAFLAPTTTADRIGGLLNAHSRSKDGFGFVAPAADVEPIHLQRDAHDPFPTPVQSPNISPIRAHYAQLRSVSPAIDLRESRVRAATPEIRLRRVRKAYLGTATINIGYGYDMVVDMLEWLRRRQVLGFVVRQEGSRLGWDFERLGLGEMEATNEMHMGDDDLYDA